MMDDQDGKTENASTPTRLVGKQTESSTQAKRQVTVTRSSQTDKNFLDVFPDGEESFPVNYQISPLLNGASPNLNVVGNMANPVLFRYTPTTKRFVESFSLFIAEAAVTVDPLDYGGIVGSLNNGLIVRYQQLGVLRTLFDFHNNLEIVSNLHQAAWWPNSATEFINLQDAFAGSILFQKGILLDPAYGDYFEVAVRDNLTQVDFHQAFIKHWGRS